MEPTEPRTGFWLELISIGLLPVLGIIAAYMLNVRNMTKELLEMHKNPAKTGFGTEGLGEALAGVERSNASVADALKDMKHLIEWMIQNNGMPAPPPRVGTVFPSKS